MLQIQCHKVQESKRGPGQAVSQAGVTQFGSSQGEWGRLRLCCQNATRGDGLMLRKVNSGWPSRPAGRLGRAATRFDIIGSQETVTVHSLICERRVSVPRGPERCRILSLRDPTGAEHTVGPPSDTIQPTGIRMHCDDTLASPLAGDYASFSVA